MNWSLTDYITMGGLLTAAGLPFAIAVLRGPNLAYRAGATLAIGASFLMTWISLAVGIIGDPNNVGNLMFAAALAIAVIGSGFALFRSRGMAHAMLAAALVLALIPAVALPLQLGIGSARWPYDVLVLSGLFAALYAVSGWLFMQSARRQTRTAAAA